jgi:predicted RecB family nuclease
MKITLDVFEAYLKCPTKCWLRATDEPSAGGSYPEWVMAQNDSYRARETRRLVAEFPNNEVALSPDMKNLKAASWRLASGLAVQAEMDSCALESELHTLERVPAEGRGKPTQLIPIRFVFTNKLSNDDKLLLAFDAFALSKSLRREVSVGRIIHGDDHAALKVKTSAMTSEVQKRVGKIAKLLGNATPPELVLNHHCAACEFQARCKQQAVEKDDLSLLSNMPEKERTKLHRKGIFTVTQLSYTFRPRRRPKKLRDKREKYHHSLKALAIREKKIHILGSPELKLEGTPIYLDIEGLPDRDFYYLIGARIGNGESAFQHSLWADSVEDEGKIWRDFLTILETVENPLLIHYGSYETTFFRHMQERYGEPQGNSSAAKALQSHLNLLSVIFTQFYFPAFSNGLKDVAASIGYRWDDAVSSGLESIAWRSQWTESLDEITKRHLLIYNAHDCEALSGVAETLCDLIDQLTVKDAHRELNSDFVRADSSELRMKSQWRTFASPVTGFEAINAAAHWDRQRDRVYVRSSGSPRKVKLRHRTKRKSTRIEKVVMWPALRACPQCGRQVRLKGPYVSKTVQDIIFGRHSLRRRLVKYVFETRRCSKCRMAFGVDERFKLFRKYGWNLVAYFFYQVIELCIPQLTVLRSFNRLFGFDLNRSTLHNLKVRIGGYYAETKQKILQDIIQGCLVHADETRANIKGEAGFVWVLTNMQEVIYVLADSREGEVVQNLLRGFQGVVVSDFYTAYDSLGCPQQRCLIHLMRDLNDEVLTNPFDDQLKQIATAFANLLKPMVETVDRHGLKKHFLRKHMTAVERFFRQLERTDYQSEAALKCKERFLRNRDKLFTFLSYDGVPWNNNNAEHAIKAFARLRDVIGGASTEKGIEEYLTLLSIFQTCEYTGLDFLDFLRSGEKDVQAFAERPRGRRSWVWGSSAAEYRF